MGVDEEEKLAIISHNATREENFLLLPYELKKKAELYFGVGAGKWSLKINQKTCHETVINKRKGLLGYKKYSFSNNIEAGCNILQTSQEWLENNEDEGFAVRGYDLKLHLKHFSVDYSYEEDYKDSYILVYSEKHNLILHIDTDPKDIHAAILYNRTNIRYLRTLHQCLIGRAILFLPITLYDETKTEEVESNICKNCEELRLLVPKKIFEKTSSLEKWWQVIESNIRQINFQELVDPSDRRECVKHDFLKSIIGYLVVVASSSKTFATTNRRLRVQNENNEEELVLLCPETDKTSTILKTVDPQIIVQSENNNKESMLLCPEIDNTSTILGTADPQIIIQSENSKEGSMLLTPEIEKTSSLLETTNPRLIIQNENNEEELVLLCPEIDKRSTILEAANPQIIVKSDNCKEELIMLSPEYNNTSAITDSTESSSTCRGFLQKLCCCS